MNRVRTHPGEVLRLEFMAPMRFLVRAAPRPAASLALRAAGVALPPTVQPFAGD